MGPLAAGADRHRARGALWILAGLALGAALVFSSRGDRTASGGGEAGGPPPARAAVPDSPTNLALDQAGDVWVTMATDNGDIGLDRYSAGLSWRGGFMSLGDIRDLAGLPGGGMVMDLSIPDPDQPDLPSLALISVVSDDMAQTLAWDLGLGEVDYVRSIAVEPDGTVDVLIAGDAGYTTIRRYSPQGRYLDQMTIEPWALDMVIGPDGLRYVVYDDPDAPRVLRYSVDGGLAGSFTLPATPTGIAIAPDGRIFIPSHEGVGDNSRVERFKPDGSSDGGFRVTGRCWKLAAGADGSLYAIIEERPSWSIQRLSANGGQRGKVEWGAMQRRRAAHPATVTALPPPPSATPSPTSSPTPSITPTRHPATRTPSPTPGGVGETPSPTAEATQDPGNRTPPPATALPQGPRIFLPSLSR